MKLMIFLGITIFGTLGGWLGSMLDHTSGIGMWSLFLSTVGSLFGIWVGYKVAKNYL
jgi:hypothetical protein